MIQTSIASTVFRMRDQEAFAGFSGDFNPIHLTMTAARRTQAGAPAVYGMLQVLWGLDHLPQIPPGMRIAGLLARFQSFLLVDEEAHLSLSGCEEGEIRLSIAVRGSVCTNLTIKLVRGEQDVFEQDLSISSDAPESRSCRICTFDDVENAFGELPVMFSAQDPRLLFPSATARIGATRVTAIAALSRLIGMICPGLHSLFRSMDIRIVPERSFRLVYSASTSDRRFSFLRQKVQGGGIEGSIDAFLRVPQTTQPTVAYIRQFVAADEFSGTTALVVGASRGLGEFTAKAIGAGGGRVIASYRIGREECDKVADEIRACGGTCDSLSYDVLKPAAHQLEAMPALPTSVYYFATTKIFSRQSELYDAAQFREFGEVYLSGFFNLCAHLRTLGVQKLAIFYPSTIAVETRPADMGVYAMAKSAGEVLCDEIAKQWPEFRVIVRRLPRLLTDQTATVLSVESSPVEEVLLPIIRDVESVRTRGEMPFTAEARA